MEERYGRHPPPPSNGPDTKTLLERFGLIPEEDFAALLGITVRSLKARPKASLPTFVKAGRRRLYVEESVREFLKKHQVDPLSW